ncbi:YegS/Rv2252/BmrU family lipid kinase [Cytophagaceae bacterium YF14B1]|uniref:YegS/Rv2252/BmrU family lipid kinase n=1 Tax=Xanthocytophaga flava TaxID=3048013 RepID=A0AAE3QQS1_9BACT|nr:YegS/Rv2252/BmrU family lipid kinase [Xanthocytophaga flavus]MDJ1483762.1 YegS/Rv2252/BmrU family lipid kinase [Xanthocytophaga flavus]
MKKNIVFVVNPRAGTRSKARIEDLIKLYIDKQVIEYDIIYTKAKSHATEIAAQAANDGAHCVVAVGGDGTMNETAAALVGTQTALSIIPLGSGNGLARHLGIPLKTEKAILMLNTSREKVIDSCTLNGRPFFCVAGTGFDAYIGLKFDQQTRRGFQTYIKTTLSEFFNYRPDRYLITLNGSTFDSESFLVSFANAGQYGNNAYISPQADIADGLVDVCLMRPFPSPMAVPLGVQLFGKTLHTSSYLKVMPTAKAIIERSADAPVHIDGEPMMMDARLEVHIKPGSLRVWLPDLSKRGF